MSKFKINLYCNDSLEPSPSDKNATKNVEWVYDGSGEVDFCVSPREFDAINDTSGKPTYIWLLESKQIIERGYKFAEENAAFIY